MMSCEYVILPRGWKLEWQRKRRLILCYLIIGSWSRVHAFITYFGSFNKTGSDDAQHNYIQYPRYDTRLHVIRMRQQIFLIIESLPKTIIFDRHPSCPVFQNLHWSPPQNVGITSHTELFSGQLESLYPYFLWVSDELRIFEV